MKSRSRVPLPGIAFDFCLPTLGGSTSPGGAARGPHRLARRPDGRSSGPSRRALDVEERMRVAILFPGQGSQYAGMADPWLAHPASRAVIERASKILQWDVADFSGDDDALKRTDVVQPAVFTCDVAAYEALRAEGVDIGVGAGHSL